MTLLASAAALPFASSPFAGDMTRSGFVVTPNDTLNYMQKVDAAMRSLNGDIAASAVDANFKSSWSGFFAGWGKFFTDHQPWYMRLSGTVYDDTENYEKNLDQWREQFIVRGGVPSAPRSGSDSADWAGVAKFAAVALVAVAAAVVVYEVRK